MEENDKKFDIRLIERHIEKGLVSREEYEAYLNNLSDAQEKSIEFDLIQPISE